jgi:hypothetical protein
VRIFKTRWLARFGRRERIADESLRDAVQRAERGIIDADLGGGLIKQRVARLGQGRSGGYRMLVAYRMRDRAIFLYGFAKNERENIDADQLVELRKIAAGWLERTTGQIEQVLEDGALEEVHYDNQSDAKPTE